MRKVFIRESDALLIETIGALAEAPKISTEGQCLAISRMTILKGGTN
jgi:hypothetical protein